MSNEDHVEVGRRVLNWALDFCAVKGSWFEPAPTDDRQLRFPFAEPAMRPKQRAWKAQPWVVGQRRLLVLATALRRPECAHVDGASIARAFGVTKQAVNLDAQRIEREFGIAMPTAHRDQRVTKDL
jgi:hypothetical protein